MPFPDLDTFRAPSEGIYAMKWFDPTSHSLTGRATHLGGAGVIALLVLAASCQRGESPPRPSPSSPAPPTTVVQLPRPPVTAAYKEDIANVCDVVHRSGADKLPPGERAPSIAMWLGPNIHTENGHEFLVAIQPLTGESKASALEVEAKRVGLDGCPLAAEWR